jgi:hypothetical protein
MSIATFLFDDYYQLKGDGSTVTLDLIFGGLGQSPDYEVVLDGTKLIPDAAHNGTASVMGFPLGKDTDLVDKDLVITGIVTNMPGTTNILSLNFRLNGGKSQLQKKYTATATAAGDYVDISLTAHLYQ